MESLYSWTAFPSYIIHLRSQKQTNRFVIPTMVTRLLQRTLLFLSTGGEANEQCQPEAFPKYFPIENGSPQNPTRGSAFKSESPLLASATAEWVWSCVSNKGKQSSEQMRRLGDIVAKVHWLSCEKIAHASDSDSSSSAAAAGVENGPENNGQKQMSSLVSHFGVRRCIDVLCKLASNIHTITSPELDVLGIGMYPFTATVNHSCSPNCAVVYKGKQQALRTICPIGKDEELKISYCDNTFPSCINRRHLLHGYKFWCSCERCHCADHCISHALQENNLPLRSRELTMKHREIYLIGLLCSVEDGKCEGLAIPDLAPSETIRTFEMKKEEYESEPALCSPPFQQICKEIQEKQPSSLTFGFLLYEFFSSLDTLVSNSLSSGGEFQSNSALLDRILSVTWRCCSCGSCLDKSILKKLLRYYQVATDNLGALQSSNISTKDRERSIHALDTVFFELEKISSRWHFLLLQVSETLTREYVDMGNYRKALQFATIVASRTEDSLDVASLKCTVHWVMVAKLHWYLNDAKETLNTLESKVIPKLNLFYGSASDDSVDTNSLVNSMHDLRAQAQTQVRYQDYCT